jgi:hypothetical protein
MKEKNLGDYSPGCFAWLFKDPIIFNTLVASRGALSLWEFNEYLLTEQLE